MSVSEKDSQLQRKHSEALYVSIVLCWILTGVFVADYAAKHLRKENIAVYDTVNPNFAPLESLTRLAGVGPATASSIIEYRETIPESKLAFTKPADLQSIKGIGPKTVEKIEPWLSFDQ
jgi:competence ComEA-like helix-hairpin-helix protein